MADPIVTITRYELLMRWDEAGALKGAHVQRRRRITLDGQVIADQMLDPEPIAAADFAAHEILGEALTDAMTALGQADALIHDQQEAIDAAAAAAQDAAARIAQLEADLAAASAIVAPAQAEDAQAEDAVAAPPPE